MRPVKIFLLHVLRSVKKKNKKKPQPLWTVRLTLHPDYLPSLHFKGAVQHRTVAHLAVWECYSMVCVWGVGNLSWSVCREAKLLWCYAKTFWSHLWLFGHTDGLQANSKQPGRHADHYYVILNREEIQTISKQQVKHSTTQRNVYCVASVAFSHAKQPAQLS